MASKTSSKDSRMEDLEKKVGKLEKEEKRLAKKLRDLEKEELEIATRVSNLEQVRKRRPDFLTDYMVKREKVLSAGDLPISKKSPKKDAAKTKKLISNIVANPAEADQAGSDRKKNKRNKKAKKVLKDVLTTKKQDEEIGVVSPGKIKSNAKRVLSKVLVSKGPSEELEDVHPKSELGEERKHIMEAQIKNVLRRQDVSRKEDATETQQPIKEINMSGKMSESVRLFRALMSRGVLSIDDAAKLLGEDKKTIKLWAKELEANGIVEVNKPLYGSPKIKLRRLSEKLQVE